MSACLRSELRCRQAPPSHPLPQHDRLGCACHVRDRRDSLQLRSKSDPGLIRRSGNPRVHQFSSFCRHIPCRKWRNSLCIRGNEGGPGSLALACLEENGALPSARTGPAERITKHRANHSYVAQLSGCAVHAAPTTKVSKHQAASHKEKRFLLRPIGDHNVNP